MDLSTLDSFYDGYGMKSYEFFGAHLLSNGVMFRLYAPNAKSVRLAGDFNNWDIQKTFMNRNPLGYWELFVAELKEYARYKYIIEQNDGKLVEKADPYGFYNELRPAWSNKVVNLDNYKWNDDLWIEKRSRNFDKPVNIYEVHLGGFKHNEDDKWYTYYELIEQLIPYVKEMGYTHIELMPLNEHGLDKSWGYQQFGYHSITSRYGSPYQLMMFIDACHQNNIGVIMDVVLAHFVKDEYGLINFDGTDLYGMDKESSWGTKYFDFGKKTVCSFLMSSVELWLDKYHIDGLRMDAVSNLIYFDGNKDLGQNIKAIEFIKQLNYYIHELHPNVMTIAEDSSDYSQVTSSTGLGFDYKWDLGWMNDTLKYYSLDPEYRHYHHNLINFSMAYFYSERFICPLSHDEVVHSKKTIIDKMWGTYEEKFAQCRNLMVYMYTHPGKKLNFMGNEIASFREFDEDKQLDWFLLKYPIHDSFKRMIRDLNNIYYYNEAFYRYDYSLKGFKWIDADNNQQRIYSYLRFDDKKCYVVILNMAPVAYENYEIGVPTYGYFSEIMNSEKDIYGGCNMCNFHKVVARKGNIHGFKYKINIRIAPYAAIIFEAKLR